METLAQSLDISEIYECFETMIKPGSKILDLGCGSGRDCKHFIEKGYKVVALDQSKAMCTHVSNMLNIPVVHMKAEEMAYEDQFDAIWACASLLHVPKKAQEETLWRVGHALKQNGICYCSWKYGNGERITDGRYFLDYTEETLKTMLQSIGILIPLKIWVSNDASGTRRNQKWINALLKKSFRRRYQGEEELPVCHAQRSRKELARL